MAKSNSILNLQGTLDGMTHVNSKRYKPHVRKARSSGEVNEVFRENNRQMTDANHPARLIKNVVDLYRQDFKGGMLWQRLVSHFKRQKKEGIPYNVAGLEGMEINEDYPLKRLFKAGSECSVAADAQALQFSLACTHHPDFKRKYPDAYVVSAIAIFPDFEAESVDHLIANSDVIPLSSACSPLAFRFSLSPEAVQYMIILKVQAYQKGKVCEGHSTKGMKIVMAGDV